jgi:hypothetical protein
MIIKDYREIGKNKEHRKLILFDEESKTSHDALAFRCERSFDSSKPISFEFTLNKNEFNNRVSIQLLIENFLD